MIFNRIIPSLLLKNSRLVKGENFKKFIDAGDPVKTIKAYCDQGADEIILSTDKGSIMRCAVKEIRVAGRNTQGVRIKKLSGSEKVVSVIKIEDNIQ